MVIQVVLYQKVYLLMQASTERLAAAAVEKIIQSWGALEDLSCQRVVNDGREHERELQFYYRVANADMRSVTRVPCPS